MNIQVDTATPALGNKRPCNDVNRTTQVLNLRALKELALGVDSAEPAEPIQNLLLEIEQNRFSFISSRDTDAAIHDLLNRIEDLDRIMHVLAAQVPSGAKPE
jgi:hypothetical protein